MYRIYTVEDDKGIAEGIKTCLEGWGMEVRSAADFRNILSEFQEYQPHLVLMDIGLPFMDGYYWCREIRRLSPVPIVFISSAADSMNIVMAVNMGGDDFIAKPFDAGVLAAKVQAMLRRVYDLKTETSLPECCGAVLNPEAGTLTYQGSKLDLTRNENRILTVLFQSKGSVVSREKLMEALWETDSFVDENTLTVNIGRLRKKLDSIGLSGLIQTKFGRGYMVGDEK